MTVVRGLAAVEGGCEKPSCTHHSARINRHHRGYDSLWFSSWHRFRGRTWWQKVVDRYWEYRKADCVRLCVYHHAEIHMLYDELIAVAIARARVPLHRFSKRAAQELQRDLRRACRNWLLLVTPGTDPDLYNLRKRARRRRLQRQAERRLR
jgi:hypothetical protein